jgi:aquaporin Z
MWNQLGAEFIGTFLLVFFGCGTAAVTHSDLNTGIAFGLILIGLVYWFGPISGAHFNPAVTLALFMTGNISFIMLLLYWTGQFAGAILAAAFLNYLLGPNTGLGASVGEFTNTDALKAVLVEMTLTFMFVSVILAVVYQGIKTELVGGLVIGFALLLGVLTGYGLTGGSLNPARSLGPAIFTNNLNTVWIYFVGPFLGALIAVFFHYVFLQRFRKPIHLGELLMDTELED